MWDPRILQVMQSGGQGGISLSGREEDDVGVDRYCSVMDWSSELRMRKSLMWS